MQKRSHTLLASALLRSQEGFDARRFELAFLFGSFQPDCNPFSYLKGSLRARKFGGHNYTNSHDYIIAHIERLQRRRTAWTMWQYYTLGKLTHYLADAFTYPHNENFPDTMLDHHRYETDLRQYLAEELPGADRRSGGASRTVHGRSRHHEPGYSLYPASHGIADGRLCSHCLISSESAFPPFFLRLFLDRFTISFSRPKCYALNI